MFNNLILKWKQLRTVWKVLIVIGVFLCFCVIKAEPWVPVGEESPDTVMAWCLKNDSNIELDRDIFKLNQGFRYGAYGTTPPPDDPSRSTFILMKNKRSGTYVFKIKNHYVYIVRIIDTVANRYIERAVEISNNGGGKLFMQRLDRSEMDSIDSNAVEDAGWNDTDLYNEFHTDDN